MRGDSWGDNNSAWRGPELSAVVDSEISGLGLGMTGKWSGFPRKTAGSTDLDQDRTHSTLNEITAIGESVGTAWVAQWWK